MLTEEEKREIIDLLLEDKPLPEKYRSRLFCARKELNHEDHGLEARILEEHSPDWPDGDPSQPYNPVWPNRLFWGDNLDVMRFLLSAEIGPDRTMTGGIKLIYIDPPFNAGLNFYINYHKDFSTCSPLAYTDIWKNGLDGCLEWLAPRLCLMRELLADDGSIFVHCDWRLNARMRLLLDDIFGFHVNEIIWHYTGGGRSARCFSRKHDSIFIYSKNRNFNFYPDQIRIPYASTSSYAKNGITARSGKKYLPNPLGAVPDDVWNIPIINPLSHERNAYPTQKPEALLKRIILSCTKPGDLVADFFCGSGVTAIVAEKLGRKWLISDIGFPAIHMSRKRLDKLFKAKSGDLPAASPFSIWTVRPDAHMREALFPASLFTLREENGILLAHDKDDLWLVFPEHAIANWEEITYILREHSPDYDNIFVLASAWTRNCLEDGRRSGIWRKTCFHLLNLPLHINPGLSLRQQCGPALFPGFQFQPKQGMLALEMTDLQWGADFLKNGLAYRPDSARKKADKSLGIVCWKKLLDSWALDPAFQLSCNEQRNQSPLSFKPFWQSDRSGGKNEPELLSPFIACSQISRLAVKVTDIFFNESLILMDGKAAS